VAANQLLIGDAQLPALKGDVTQKALAVGVMAGGGGGLRRSPWRPAGRMIQRKGTKDTKEII
jgi:hypothetical protein